MPDDELRVPRARLYPGRDDDLITWLTKLEQLPSGARSQAVKDLLRRGLAADAAPAASAGLGAALNTDQLLGDIRRVVEVALEEALARLPTLASTSPLLDEQGEAEALIDTFGASLLFPDDE